MAERSVPKSGGTTRSSSRQKKSDDTVTTEPVKKAPATISSGKADRILKELAELRDQERQLSGAVVTLTQALEDNFATKEDVSGEINRRVKVLEKEAAAKARHIKRESRTRARKTLAFGLVIVFISVFSSIVYQQRISFKGCNGTNARIEVQAEILRGIALTEPNTKDGAQIAGSIRAGANRLLESQVNCANRYPFGSKFN